MDIIELNNIATFEFFVDLDFRVEGSFCVLILIDFGLIYDFDCHLFLCFLVNTLENFWKSTVAQPGSKKNYVLSYPLFRVVHADIF